MIDLVLFIFFPFYFSFLFFHFILFLVFILLFLILDLDKEYDISHWLSSNTQGNLTAIKLSASIMVTGEDMTMDGSGVDHCLFLNNCDNYDDVRGVVSARNDTGSINSYAPSEMSDVPYCDRVGEENDMDVDDKHADESYVSQTSQAASVNLSSSQQHVSNENTPLNQNTSSNMFNVHLNYDPNIALNPDSWDGNFHAVSLHGSMEHLASDTLNIKESLSRMRKYILGKSIENSGANDVEDFKGMGKAMWK